MRRYSLNSSGSNPFGLAAQSSWLALQGSGSSQMRARSTAEQGAGSRRPTLTLDDLGADSKPFEHLRNIDKPPPSARPQAEKSGDGAGAPAASLWTSRVSFSGTGNDDVIGRGGVGTPLLPLTSPATDRYDARARPTTPEPPTYMQQPMTSLFPEKGDVRRTWHEPPTFAQQLMTSSLPDRADVGRTWQESAYTQQPMTPLFPEKADVRRAWQEPPTYTQQPMTSVVAHRHDITRISPEPQYTREPMTSSVPEKADVWRTKQEPMTSSGHVYPDAKLGPRDPTTSSVPGYAGAQEMMMSSACVDSGTAPAAHGNRTFSLGRPTVAPNVLYPPTHRASYLYIRYDTRCYLACNEKLT